MSEKPITQRIKDRLAAYTAMLRDIDNQLERLDRMEMTMASPPGPDLTGMPRGSGTPSDRTGMMVERKMELEEQIDRLKAEEKQERNAIEGLILQLSDPDERAVIRLRYFDRADWESTCGVLFGDRRDYVDRVDAYLNTRTPGGPFSQRSHNILMGTGNTKSDGTSWIPFQRMSKTRTDIKKLTTISVPQMITSDRTNEAIMLRLNTETSKRLEHHMKRALGL